MLKVFSLHWTMPSLEKSGLRPMGFDKTLCCTGLPTRAWFPIGEGIGGSYGWIRIDTGKPDSCAAKNCGRSFGRPSSALKAVVEYQLRIGFSLE